MRKLIILLLFVNISSAQYNLFARQNFAYKSVSVITTNTEIGGVSGTITSASSLATKLGISVGNISNFTIVGSDIKCKITGSYVIPANFYAGTTNITYYKDVDGLVTSIGTKAFYTCSYLKYVEFKNAIAINDQAFDGDTTFMTLEYVYVPLCTVLGATSGYNTVFRNCYSVTLYCSPILATNNSSLPDGDISSTTLQLIMPRYVTNFTAPSAITTLAPGIIYNTAVQLAFTPPSSTNAIEYYNVYVNGVLNNKSIDSASGVFAVGLTAATSSNITAYAVDIFRNESVVSNSVSVSTTSYTGDTDASAYITASSNSAYQYQLHDLFKMLKDNSLYIKLQAFYPLLGTTSTQHKWNGKNPLDTDAAFRLTFSGTATFSDSGYTPNGTTGYANTHFIPSVNQNVNSNGITVIVGTNNATASSDVIEVGSFNSGTQRSWVGSKNNNSNYSRNSVINGSAVFSSGINDAKGIYTGSRQSSTVTDLFRNGMQLATGNSGGNLPTYPIWVGAMNLTNTPYGYSNQRIQSVWIHEGLIDSEITTFHIIIDAFETALGRKTW